jgi:ABC-2 type transport system ATP-binding protein
MHALKGQPGVEMVTSFGAQLHVAGADAQALSRAIEDIKSRFTIEAETVPPTLEDIFIHTMTRAKENGTAQVVS